MFAATERSRFENVVFWGLAALAFGVWAWHALPLLTGDRTLYLRDVLHNHFALKWVGAQALRQGEIPVFVEQLGNGLPFRGNPSALPFYPGNVLYLILPFWSAFGGHFALHWLLAGLTMFWLGRTLGLGRFAALMAAVTYAGGGWFASAMSFYNVTTIAAWWPAVIAAAVRGGAGGVAFGGAACGMALLGGEPLTALLGMLPVVALAVGRHGQWRGLGIAAAIGGTGVLIALPQIAATAEVLSYSFRDFRVTPASEADLYFFKWPRLLELVIPFPFGHPGFVGTRGWWLLDRLPFYFCLNAGLVGTWLATRTVRLRAARLWILLAVLGVLAAWVGGVDAELVRRLSGGLFRYTEKFLFWPALAVPILAGLGLEEVLRRAKSRAAGVSAGSTAGSTGAPAMASTAPRQYPGTLLFALVLAVAAVAALRSVPGLVRFLTTEKLPPESLERALLAQALTLAVQLAGSALLLVVLVFVVHRGWRAAIVGLQILVLVPVLTLVMTDSAHYYDDLVPWLHDLPASAGVVDTTALMPPWGVARYLFEGQERYRIERVDGLATSSVTGLLAGFRYPLQIDSEGMGQATYSFLMTNLYIRDWTERARWLAILGVDDLIAVESVDVPEIETIDSRRFAGPMLHRLRIRDPLPAAYWPEEVLPEPSPSDTLRRVSKIAQPRKTVLAQMAVPDHRPGGSVAVREHRNDRIVLSVESDGGMFVVQRLFHPRWRAFSGATNLPTTVASLVLLGVVVPAGSHEVVIEPAPGLVPWAGGLAILVALACGGVAWRHRHWLFGDPHRVGAPGFAAEESSREPA